MRNLPNPFMFFSIQEIETDLPKRARPMRLAGGCALRLAAHGDLNTTCDSSTSVRSRTDRARLWVLSSDQSTSRAGRDSGSLNNGFCEREDYDRRRKKTAHGAL